MKKGKQIAIALVCCLILSVLMPCHAQAARVVKLNKTKVTVQTGKTYKLKVTGTTKKVTWSSKNPKVATVTKQGLVKGVTPGSTKVVAKVGKKSYTCNVTVAIDTAAAIKKLKVTYKESNDYTYAFVTNENPFPLNITGKMNFYNDKNQYLSKASDNSLFVTAKSTVVMRFLHPMENGKFYSPASHSDVEFTVQKTVNKDGRSFVTATTELSPEGKVLVNVTNTGKNKLAFVRYTLVMCDAEGNILGSEQYHFTKMTGTEVVLMPNQSIDHEFVLRVDGKMVPIETYELYLDYAIYM